MLDFLEFIFYQGLMDISLVGGNLIWSNNHDSQSWSRIDRFLLSPEWEEQFLDVSQRTLPSILSDHFPLMLDCDVSVGILGLLSLKICSWLCGVGEHQGSPSYVLVSKFQALK